jgi:lipoprotein-anchoring transpeptidase ErfK/SrfK
MLLRTAGAFTALLIGLAGSVAPATAQFFPPPGPRFVPMRPLPPPVDVEDDTPAYDPPPGYRAPPPPGQYGSQAPYGAQPRGNDPTYVRPLPQYGDTYPQDPEPYPPPGGGYQQRAVPGYEPADPRPRPNYGAATPGLLPNPLDILRPPGAMGSVGPNDPAIDDRGATGSTGPVYSALPPEDRPELGPKKELPAQFRRTMVEYRTREPAGTLIIDTANTYLYLALGNGKAMRYGIGVGREGFTWAGAERVSRMAEWPDWHPPSEMIERQPYLPRFMAGGEGNPLGARALYLGKTLYRIHGTNQPSTIGSFVSSGCIRLTNEDISDLYTRVQVGTRVVVLPGRPPATANAGPVGSQAEQNEPPQPYNPLAPRR